MDKRLEYFSEVSKIDSESFVYVDECGSGLNLSNKYGYSLKGTKCFDDDDAR